MKKSSSWIRPEFKKNKKLIYLILFVSLALAYPLHLASSKIATFFLINDEYRAAEVINVSNGGIDLQIYSNIGSNDYGYSFTDKILKTIDSAQNEIQIAMYSFNITEIRDALVKAANRGVKVDIYLEYAKSDDYEIFFQPYKSALSLHYVAKYENEDEYYRMHHKFMLVDPGTERQVLVTGPWNWSYYQEDLDPNLIVITSDAEIIKSFSEEITRINRGFSGYNKFRDLVYMPWDKKIIYPNGESLEVWFSPGRDSNSIESRVLYDIRHAENKIDIAMTIFDSNRIAQALLNKAKDGTEIRIIVNKKTINEEENAIPWLREKIKANNLKNITIFEGGSLGNDTEAYSIFHHHTMIVDGEKSMISTANWTYGGFFINDENTFFINSKGVAEDLQKIFNDYLKYLEVAG
jgi:phosphatidylserine/phosphatidylglycerophosphate/cardiolipin synthase-like enzyme